MIRVLLLASMLAAAGCSTLARAPAPGDRAAFDARSAALALRSAWRLEGRAAVAAEGEGYSGTLAWAQQGEALDLSFDGPLGLGGLRIRGDAAALEVETSKGERFTVTDPERDLEARLGWSMPVRSMRYWLVGIPDPAAVFDAEVDADGLPVRIVQRGWDVRYESWQAVGDDRLPRRITLERADLRIRVVAERWVFAAGGTP